MGLLSKFKVSALVIVLLVIMRIHPYEACRVLEDKGGVWERRGGHLLGSLQKGPVPSGPSGCTNVPGNPGPSCPMQEMHFAGDALAHAGAYPPQVIPLGVASSGQWSYCYDWKFLFLFFFPLLHTSCGCNWFSTYENEICCCALMCSLESRLINGMNWVFVFFFFKPMHGGANAFMWIRIFFFCFF